MYTQCPECLTVYKLDAAQLVPACGCVCCRHCGTVFNALGTLAEQLPPEPFERLAEHALDREPPLVDMAVFRPAPAVVAVKSEAPPDPPSVDSPGREGVGAASDAPADAAVADEDFSQLRFTPRFARQRRRPWRTLAWVLVCLVLVAGLVAQLAWAQRRVLVADPTLGPWLARACDVLGCPLPQVAAPDRLRLMARDVEQHPSVAGALLITASVRNDAPFAQPYPLVTVTLSDAAGKRLAMRRFQPSEYVEDPALRARGLPAGAVTAMVFEVQDPGQQAVSFAFSFN